VAAHLTEEEQIEAIKRWWQSNGKWVVGAIVVAVLAWFGWSSWQERQERLAQEASSKYTELLTLVGEGAGDLSEQQRSTAKVIAQEIIDTDASNLYGNMAGLFLAQLAVHGGELDQAESHLQGVATNAANDSMKNLANLRLARVAVAQGNFSDALALLDEDVHEAYQAAYAEARGDIYMAQDQLEQAQVAYQVALATLGPQQSGRSGILQLKLENTRVAGQGESEAPSEPTQNAPAAEGDA
jgi:predicted negative regulator of RcsB-dependent stress response